MPYILSFIKHEGRSAARAARCLAAGGVAAAATLLAPGSPAKAAVHPPAYCMPELARLSAQWDFIGFGTPQKPSQQIVNSRIGLTASAPEVTFIRDQLRQAFWDCRHGFAGMAQARAALVAERMQELR